ncbi:MAG TPA: alanine racemase, partial [Candidatus Omnitrophica bacterium]|nr:alanine racemase [Candidatus Omnitrophota bacterium]
MEKNTFGYRPTWAEINLKHIVYNINSIRKIVSKDTRILATVKADAYGHGIIPVSKTLVGQSVDYLGVASIDEAVLLRNSGIKSSILVLGGILPQDAEAIIRYGLTQTVYTESVARALNMAAKRANSKARVHIKVDTGMGRLGVWHRDALSFIDKINNLAFIDMEGVFTHLSSADSDTDFTNEQIAIFDTILRKLESRGVNIRLRHAANSAGLIDFKSSHYNLVRPGIIIYGLIPSFGIQVKVKPVLSIKTKIIYIKKTPKGRSISYGRSFVTKKNTMIAT